MASPTNDPNLMQQAAVACVAILSIIIGVYKYIKTEVGKTSDKSSAPAATGAVVAASFVDSKLMRELIDALREHQEEHSRIALRVTRASNELREAILDNTEHHRVQTDALLEALRLNSLSNARG